jgi:hypothetical protein
MNDEDITETLNLQKIKRVLKYLYKINGYGINDILYDKFINNFKITITKDF